MYGKLIDGNLIEAPADIDCELKINGVMMQVHYFDPTDKQYAEAGFLPVITEDQPADGGHYMLTYTERKGVIYGEWIECDPPQSEAVPTLEERVSECEDALVELAEIITEGV